MHELTWAKPFRIVELDSNMRWRQYMISAKEVSDFYSHIFMLITTFMYFIIFPHPKYQSLYTLLRPKTLTIIPCCPIHIFLCYAQTPYIAKEKRFQCGPDEFKCTRSNHCIPIANKCNRKYDCLDWSDEIACRKCHIYFFCVCISCVSRSLCSIYVANDLR